MTMFKKIELMLFSDIINYIYPTMLTSKKNNVP